MSLTVMASMLEAAREDGVQASADFLWLKPLDRRLWYTLNTVGRQTPFIEVAGIFAHWVAEKEAGRKLFVPMVEEATNALELALKEVVYKPDEVMKRKDESIMRIRGLEEQHELSPQLLLRDTRTLGMKIVDFFKDPVNSAILMMAFAMAAFVFPAVC